MIVTFSVSNFRSFSDEETLSMVASKKLSTEHDGHTSVIPHSSEKVLRAAVLYGANGAGKSNLFKALQLLKELATLPRPKKSVISRTPFFSSKRKDTPTSLDLQFIAGTDLYRFGIEFNDDQIIEEWLVKVVGSKERVLYERKTSPSGEVTATIQRGFKVSKRLRALFSVGGPANQTLLATIKANLNKEDIGDELNRVLNWFLRELTLISPDEPFMPVGHTLTEDPDFLTFAGDFLKHTSTGVDHLEVAKKEISKDELRKSIPEKLLEHLLASAAGSTNHGGTIVGGPDGEEYVIEDGTDGHYYRIAVESAHICDSETVRLPIQEESDGTRRLLELLPTLHKMKGTGSIYFIDEIDRSLHPILVHKFLEFFLKFGAKGQHQIIMTTHESTLLNLSLLRRDEIWFAEKDQKKSTHIYSLADFKIRNDLDVQKHYMQGRFGAIPFLASLDQVMVEEEA